ncbi:hypothetical protein OAI32_00130 [Gammaproteobacteria bacterium]|jgi:hypothetical protein|nr:hypothetical protein [Gammaproteobacteria bacterium]
MKNIFSPLYTSSARAYYSAIYNSNPDHKSKILQLDSEINNELGLPNYIFGNLSQNVTNLEVSLDFFLQPAVTQVLKLEKAQHKKARNLLSSFLVAHQSIDINFLFIENAVNPIEESLLGFGLKPSNKYFSVIRVGEDMNKYKTSIRKSYKSLVNWGMKNLEIQIMNSESLNKENFLDFKKLHLQASGRQTRSDESWDRQYDAIQNNHAFGIFGYLDDKLETGGLFFTDDRNCYYASSASNRDLFDKGLMHSIIFSAVEYCMSNDFEYIVLGDKVFDSQSDKKIISISDFKSGFANEILNGRLYQGNIHN